ncbi:MAG TPA: CheR family methyltransferase [Fontimonas sp.]
MSASSVEPGPREFVFSTRDFARVRSLIHARAGIALADSKQDMVYSRLSRRLRALGMNSFGEYLDRLGREDEPEWEAFTNALTTNLTSFFREAHHFDQLRALLLASKAPQPLRLWCSASSTGEEPYSMAISACEAFDTLQPPVRILATDLDTQVLGTASRGVYPLERVERLPRALLQKYFRRGAGSASGLCRVRDELRALIEFRQLNLLDARYPMRGPFEAIFCRNVMIYFDKPTQRAVLQRMMPLLAPEGRFFAGHSESFFHAVDLVASCGRTVYRHPNALQSRSA